MSIRILMLIGVVWMISCTVVQGQSERSAAEILVERMKLATKEKEQELIYIQTSKGVYETEEDFWFKVYLLESHLFTPSKLSETLYVTLKSISEDRVVWREKYQVEDGFVNGHILLGETIPSGEYLLTVFTSASFKNTAENFYASRRVKVVSQIEDFLQKTPAQTNEKTSLIDFKLFPEGGNLISGIKSRTAFKAVDEYGDPIAVSGTLYAENKTIVKFKTIHGGMGSFDFTPHDSLNYHIRLNENDSTYNLPKLHLTGLGLHLEALDESSMAINVSYFGQKKVQQVYVRIQTRGVIYTIAEGIVKDSLKIKLPIEKIPQGIAEVTLLDEDFNPVAERLVYLNPRKKLNINVNLEDGESYKSKEQVIVKLKVTDGDGVPVATNLGVSVYDWAYGNKSDPKNIMTHYYLSSQLKGKIHNPGYYFKEEHENRLEALDLLLLTQGWRKYSWTEVNLKKISIDDRVSLSDGIEGVIINQKKRVNRDNLPVIVAYNPLDEGQKGLILLDSTGRFTITADHLKLGQGGYTYLRLLTEEKAKFLVELYDSGFQVIDSVLQTRNSVYPSHSIRTSQVKDSPFRSVPGMMELAELEISGRRLTDKREKYLAKLDSLAKSEMTDYVCKYNILNCEYHVNDEDNFRPEEGGMYLYTEYLKGNEWVRGHPKLNGAKYFRNPQLPPYQYPEFTDEYLFDRFKIVRTKGYYGHREFYQPNYDTDEVSVADFRNTLFWNPFVLTDENGEASFSFFTSDLNTMFVGSIEGVSNSGLLGRKGFEITVGKEE